MHSVAPGLFVEGGDVNFRNIFFTKFGSKQQRDKVVQNMCLRLEDGIEDVESLVEERRRDYM